MHLCTCLEFYSAQHFGDVEHWFIMFCRAFLPLFLLGSVSLLSFGVGIGVMVVLRVRDWVRVRVRVSSMSYLCIIFFH